MAALALLEDSVTARPVIEGIVISNKMQKTVVLEISALVKHPKYGKYIKHAKKYKAHDPGNTRKIGEKVDIEECRPISKDKHFKVL